MIIFALILYGSAVYLLIRRYKNTEKKAGLATLEGEKEVLPKPLPLQMALAVIQRKVATHLLVVELPLVEAWQFWWLLELVMAL